MALLKVRLEDGTIVEVPALKGDKGDKGDRGNDGINGITPVRGVDYWTAEDQQRVINSVLDLLPDAEKETF